MKHADGPDFFIMRLLYAFRVVNAVTKYIIIKENVTSV
jgi:hypothetical protein